MGRVYVNIRRIHARLGTRPDGDDDGGCSRPVCGLACTAWGAGVAGHGCGPGATQLGAVKLADADVQKAAAALAETRDAYIPSLGIGSTVGTPSVFPRASLR